VHDVLGQVIHVRTMSICASAAALAVGGAGAANPQAVLHGSVRAVPFGDAVEE
jgi:hypothetical protein